MANGLWLYTLSMAWFYRFNILDIALSIYVGMQSHIPLRHDIQAMKKRKKKEDIT